VKKEDTMASTQSEVKTLLDSWSLAIRKRDIDRLMPLYAPDITYFDCVPPLQFVGHAAVRKNFLRWFDSWKSDIGVEIRELKILASDDVAFASMLHGTSGTRKDGNEVGYWLRATVGCRRSDQAWLITHEHISVPVDFKTRSAVMDLTP
jgi:ketosteroid isomerase-like protein